MDSSKPDFALAPTLAEQFSELNEYLGGGGDFDGALQRVVHLAVSAIPACSWAAITGWSDRDGPTTLASSEPTAQQVDSIQYRLGQGPCLTAVDELAPVHIDDLTAETRWPEFAAAVLESTPVRSVLSLHLVGTGKQSKAALNLYGPAARAFDDANTGVGILFARHVQGLMWHSQSADRAAQLEYALGSSRQIGTAIGILMALHGMEADPAFAMLSERSQQLNRKLRAVADEVVRTGALPESRPAKRNGRRRPPAGATGEEEV